MMPVAMIVVGFGSASYPNNYSAHLYDEVNFPVLREGVKNCAVCHGATNANWKSPPERNHPAGQAAPTRVWRATCGACHSSTDAAAHIDAMTAPSGAESCAVCHGAGREFPVEHMHKTR